MRGSCRGASSPSRGSSTRGVLHPIALFDKPDPLDGPFFEETIYVTPSARPAGEQARIEAAIAQAARAFGLSHGPVHAECRVNPDGVFVHEVAARPIGGLCARALRVDGPAGQGRPYEELLLRHALGEPMAGWRREARASGVMMIPIPRRGFLKARRRRGRGGARRRRGRDPDHGHARPAAAAAARGRQLPRLHLRARRRARGRGPRPPRRARAGSSSSSTPRWR